MNILYLNNQMTIGGVAKCILKLSKELSTDNRIFILSKEYGALLPEFEKIGIKNIPIIDVKSKVPHNIILNVIKIANIVRKEKIDIIHSHHRMTTLLAKLVSKITHVKVIHTQHAIIKDKRILTKLSLRNTFVIAVSNAIRENLINSYKLSSDMIETIYNGIDDEKSNMEIDERILKYKSEGYFLIGCISRITQNKGIEIFIDAAKKICKDNKKIRFIVIGDGEKRLELEKYCKETQINNIDFLGFRLNIIDYISKLDLIVQPSYSEGLGLTAIEALSQSKPVIASNIPGLNEVIIDDYNGKLFPAGDSKKLMRNIYYIYLNELKYNTMCNNAFEYYKNNFEDSKYYLKHKKVYKKILG